MAAVPSHVFGLADVFAWVTASVRSGAAVAAVGAQKAATASGAIPIVSLLGLAPTTPTGTLLLSGALALATATGGGATGQDADKKCPVFASDPGHPSRANPEPEPLGPGS